jgi:hypothetical protein
LKRTKLLIAWLICLFVYLWLDKQDFD